MAAGGCLTNVLAIVLLFTDLTTVASHRPSRKESKVDKYLKRLNKPPLKSIQSPDGDIIDCVNLTQQPAFDHPLLKDHKAIAYSLSESIMRDVKVASLGEKASVRKKASMTITQPWQKYGRCPKGSVPIRRTKRSDLLRASSIKRYGRKRPGAAPRLSSLSTDVTKQPGYEHAILFSTGLDYLGGGATISVWNPHVQPRTGEFSSSQIYVVGGLNEDNSLAVDYNSIAAGWQVYPNMYGDNQTRFFISWTNDGQHCECYNLVCPGFIQINEKFTLGAAIAPLSTSKNTYEITLLLFKNSTLQRWFLCVQNVVLGYWPAFIFSHMRSNAQMIQWGGEVFNSYHDGQFTSTQMGNGALANEGSQVASYMKDVHVVDGSYLIVTPNVPQIFSEHYSCYNAIIDDSCFFYGGTGRSPWCQ